MKNDWYWFLKTRGWESFFGKELKLILKKGEIDQLLTTCLGFGINFVFYPSGQSQKKTKIFQIARFLLQKFSEKTRKLHQVSNSRQIRVKSVFANFKHNHGPNMLHMVHLKGIQITHAHFHIIWTLFRLSVYPDTYSSIF